ncbi:MAG: NAD(P)-binding protein, partial [Chloroflexota bacterium]|nr:NAD(P)-binding protein [Chloroflexota bacterium]
MNVSSLPVAVIGAGPVGLAAAAHLVRRGERPPVLEAAESVGASVLAWGHVRLFSPWGFNVDPAAAALLAETGWVSPAAEALPTGRELVDQYLAPLARHPRLAPAIRLGARVLSVTRPGYDKLKSPGRADAPFVLHVRASDGSEDLVPARAVIDAAGTWTGPNPL